MLRPVVCPPAVSAAHTVSEDGQNDQYAESSLHSSSTSSSPAARHHHGDSLRALSSSQVVNHKWVCVTAAAMAIAVQTRPGLCLLAESPGWKLYFQIFPEIDLLTTVSLPFNTEPHSSWNAEPSLMFLSSYSFMYFITESAAIECGCVLGGTLYYFLHGVLLHDSFQRVCVCSFGLTPA